MQTETAPVKHRRKIEISPSVEISAPPVPIEKFFKIATVPGTIANCAVEEIVIQGEKVVSRKIVSDRDNRLGAEARMLAIMSRQNRIGL